MSFLLNGQSFWKSSAHDSPHDRLRSLPQFMFSISPSPALEFKDNSHIRNAVLCTEKLCILYITASMLWSSVFATLEIYLPFKTGRCQSHPKFRHFLIEIPGKVIDFHLPVCDIIRATILIP